MNDLYGTDFFRQMATCRDRYRVLADCIRAVCMPFRSVTDLGCGAGYVIERLQERGADVIGYDLFAKSDVVTIVPADLTTPCALCTGDLVICTETAEHLPESAADTLVDNVVCAAKTMIVWSAAPPGQAGKDRDAVGHINEQPASYWLERFARRRWSPHAHCTAELRSIMSKRIAQHVGCRHSFHVLVPSESRAA